MAEYIHIYIVYIYIYHMNTGVGVSFSIMVFSSMCPVVGLLGYIVVLFLDFFKRNIHIVLHNGDAG